MSKTSKQPSDCLKRAETSIILFFFGCKICAYTVTVALHESGIRKAILWSVTIYIVYLKIIYI